MRLRTRLVLLLCSALACSSHAVAGARPKNSFANPSFEMGQQGWHMSKAGKTAARFAVDNADAADGQHSALVTIERVESWGSQFGQSFPAGQKGRTYTFAVLAKATKAPVVVDLQIERRSKPYDRAAKTGQLTLNTGKWTELHVTFKVEKDFPQGWFAYISCTQAQAQYRADAFRLYEGGYTPFAQQAEQEAAVAGVRLFDTGRPSSAPLTADAVRAKQGWRQVAEGKAAHRFQGDAVLVNNRLAVALRRAGRGAEVYSLGAKGATLRATLAPVGARPVDGLASATVRENEPSRVVVDTIYRSQGANALALSYELSMGQVFVGTSPGRGARALRVEAPCRTVVLPDFFADDIVIDAAELPVAEAELATDHFLLHLLGDGEAIVAAVRSVAGEDVGVSLAGQGAERRVTGSMIRYGKGGKIWVAVLDAPRVWHTHAVARDDAGKILRLDWTQPFPAQWRVDWRRHDGFTDSWEMAVRQRGGKFVKHGWFGGAGTLPATRSRWTTVLGRFPYPCWVDIDGRGYLQPLSKKVIRFEGPALLYPINRVPDTPLDTFTVVDIVRATLGVGPCEYVLDVEGQHTRSKGRATCSTRDTLNPIYAKGQQKQQRAKIERTLDEVMAFIRYIRWRIEGYVEFGHKLLAYLGEQKTAHPELAERLAELEALAREIDARVAARRDKIRTPDEAAKQVEEFRRTMLDYTGPDAAAKCKRFTKALVVIGGNQDELVGECRWAVKLIRQRAGVLVALEPRMAEVAREIRRRSQKVLRNPAGHEGARH